jgi:anaerobic ribonucleoside-triphosphate reductase activating protein
VHESRYPRDIFGPHRLFGDYPVVTEYERPSFHQVLNRVEYICIPDSSVEYLGGTTIEINLAGFSCRSAVNGPGLRGVIWVQGCPIRCPGCFNQEFLDFRPRRITEVDDLIEHVLGIPGIEGVTFSGGEPFAQANALGELGMNLQEQGLNVVTFSGFPYSYLREKNRRSWRSLLQVTDLLIAGPYRAGESPRHPLIVSSNQSMVFLSDRFKERIPAERSYRGIELYVGSGGDIMMTGFPDYELIRSLNSQGYVEGDACVTLQQGQNQN